MRVESARGDPCKKVDCGQHRGDGENQKPGCDLHHGEAMRTRIGKPTKHFFRVKEAPSWCRKRRVRQRSRNAMPLFACLESDQCFAVRCVHDRHNRASQNPPAMMAASTTIRMATVNFDTGLMGIAGHTPQRSFRKTSAGSRCGTGGIGADGIDTGGLRISEAIRYPWRRARRAMNVSRWRVALTLQLYRAMQRQGTDFGQIRAWSRLCSRTVRKQTLKWAFRTKIPHHPYVR